MGDRITYVGLDVHKEGIVVAVAEGGVRGEVREHGRIANTTAVRDRVTRKLGRDAVQLRFCYEAELCGYGIQRHLTARGHDCVVVAPSLIPKRAGERIKTDRRDAASLARLHRAGELAAVWVPDPGHEAMRDPGLRVMSREFSEQLSGCAIFDASQPGAIVVGDEGGQVGVAFGMVEKTAVVGGAVLRHAAQMLAEAAVEALDHAVWFAAGMAG